MLDHVNRGKDNVFLEGFYGIENIGGGYMSLLECKDMVGYFWMEI